MQGDLTSVRVENFKAVADSQKLELTPLTVFIGNNGSGKSSIVEAMQTLQRLILIGLDGAMQAFKGMEHVKNKSVSSKSARRSDSDESILFHAIRFLLWGNMPSSSNDKKLKFQSETTLNANGSYSRYFVETDEVRISQRFSAVSDDVIGLYEKSDADELRKRLGPFISRWQFLTIDPSRMGEPAATRRTSGPFLLDPSGSNLADYLWHLFNDYGENGTDAWNGIVEALRFVLPYAGDVQPTMTTELERRSLFVLQERFGKDRRQSFGVPGWMLSTGTMRVLALLAVLRHPDPAPLICIEEIENGLDPRTLRLVVNEIQSLIESKRSQVILTTHSPYLLDLLPLSSIVMTQRTEAGVIFTRPGDQKAAKDWANDFAPGQLYLMGRFARLEGE